MPSFATTSLALLAPFVGYAAPQFTANFTTHGYMQFTQGPGFVAVHSNFNFSGVNQTGCPGGLNYHIHTHPVGTGGCASTQGHYIPNAGCENGFGNQETHEIGDLSGRFGAFNTTVVDRTDYFPQLFISSLVNRSVTLHCGSPRVACASLESGSVSAPTYPNAPAVAAYEAKFDYQGSKAYVSLDQNGLYVQTVNSSALCAQAMSYHIHEKWTHNTTTTAGAGAQCGAAYTGGHYDPFVGCGGASEYAGTNLCNCSSGTASYSTRCTTTAGGYGCELGDLSGRFGKLPSQVGPYNATHQLSVLPPVGVQLSVVVHCGSSRVACAKLSTCGSGGCMKPAGPPSPVPSPVPSPAPNANTTSSASLMVVSSLAAILALF